ncbi:RcnB family protein [Sphingomonas profundi]|uniref:RcnB family protein n=1 Tax=Alterirhizorhabdus profundi TaxID=2681549 RepID=UPI0012E86420|nr:RcnB family protein [Sphingomonas profundi]
MHKMMISALIAATAASGLASAAQAQSAAEVRHDRRELREEQRDLRDAQRYGTRRDVREQRRDVREARQELREDWRDYRRTNGDVFRGPAYAGPRGWRYRPIGVGGRLAPIYYGPRYVIADPYRYRLPRPGVNRWVRYGNDVLLVNPRSGRVVTVYNSFFY